jgi:hypothetical protein
LLIQDLVQIPIQLDALCFTWNEGLGSEMKFDTMTAVYRAIEDSLWKKDILRLEKTQDGKPITETLVQDCDPSEIEPVTLLQEHKYDPRYDIFWRFVAGLLDADGGALSFFRAIEEGPYDLLGPTHQRLVMHCLSEVERKKTTFTELRTKLEKQLER